MSQPIVSFLLVLAFVLPVLGAALLRVVGPRLASRQVIAAAALLVAVPIVSVVVLSRAAIPSLQIAGVTVLLEDQPQLMSLPAVPLTIDQVTDAPATDALPTVASAPTDAPMNAPAATGAPASTIVIPPKATLAATATPDSPTSTSAPPTATPEPPTNTPEPSAPPAAVPVPTRRTYRVKSGDTLRSIAVQFKVSVQVILDANKLTPAQADALKIDQELIIP